MSSELHCGLQQVTSVQCAASDSGSRAASPFGDEPLSPTCASSATAFAAWAPPSKHTRTAARARQAALRSTGQGDGAGAAELAGLRLSTTGRLLKRVTLPLPVDEQAAVQPPLPAQPFPLHYPALCPAVLCNLAGMICPF
jgi:hypothetical protein